MLYIETNLIVGIAKGQDPAADALIFGPPTAFRLAIPAICCMEALSVHKREDKQRRIIRDGFNVLAREARRDLMSSHANLFAGHLSQAIFEFEETSREMKARLTEGLHQIASVAELIVLDPAVLQESLRTQLLADLTDNLILHCILDHARKAEAGPKAFASRNHRDFEREPAQSAISAAGIRYFARIDAAMGWLGTHALS